MLPQIAIQRVSMHLNPAFSVADLKVLSLLAASKVTAIEVSGRGQQPACHARQRLWPQQQPAWPRHPRLLPPTGVETTQPHAELLPTFS